MDLSVVVYTCTDPKQTSGVENPNCMDNDGISTTKGFNDDFMGVTKKDSFCFVTAIKQCKDYASKNFIGFLGKAKSIFAAISWNFRLVSKELWEKHFAKVNPNFKKKVSLGP